MLIEVAAQRLAELEESFPDEPMVEAWRRRVQRKQADYWFEVARSGPVVRRALVYLVVVGSILVAINHGDALMRGEVDSARLFKMILTPLVPYAVSTLSSVGAIREAAATAAALRQGP